MQATLGVDARCLNSEHVRGIGRYVFELLQNSRACTDFQWCLFGNDTRRSITAPAGLRCAVDVFEFKGDRFQLWEQIGLPRRAKRRAVDLLHCTEGSLPLWQPVPTVVTLHDTLAWEERPDDAFSRFYFDALMPAALKKAASIVTISESSRNDILARWPWLQGKLHVIPHGIADDYFADDNPRPAADLLSRLAGDPYLVYMGGPMERKRHRWALNVFARSGDERLKLVLCGFGDAARRDAQASLPHELRGKVIFASYLSDAELRGLYRHADAVLYPTLYEGFGFPAVEAQASGTPVLMSNLGSLGELVGPLAMVVPPHDLDAWLSALCVARSLGDRRTELARAAKAWVHRFSWRTSLESHLEVYRRALGAPNHPSTSTPVS